MKASICDSQSHQELPKSDASAAETNDATAAETKDATAAELMALAELDRTDEQKIKVYKRRWLLLLLFCACSMSSAYQWIHLNIVFDVILANYNESLPGDATQANLAIDWLSMIYMLAYIVFMLPAAWVLERYGMRVTSICATLLNFAGALVKCFATHPTSFWLLFTGQTICAAAQSFILGFPAPLAATWFGVDQVSTATALGVFGNRIGVALGFVVPPLFVSRGPQMRQQLLAMYIGGACVTGALVLLVLLLFRDRPPLPPSIGQRAVREKRRVQEEKGSLNLYLASLKRLMTNSNFVLLTASYGINTGTFYALSTLLNPIVVPEFKKAEFNNATAAVLNVEEHVGWAAFTMVIAGIAGSLLAGFVLDKTKEFKLTTLAIYVLSCASTILFTGTLPLVRMWIVYVSMFLLGFFMTGYLPVGFEFAAEITYPENEGLSTGILNVAAQVMGIVFTISVRAVVDNMSILAGNGIFCGLLALGSVMTAIIKSDLRRQRANKTIEIDIIDEQDMERLEEQTKTKVFV